MSARLDDTVAVARILLCELPFGRQDVLKARALGDVEQLVSVFQ